MIYFLDLLPIFEIYDKNELSYSDFNKMMKLTRMDTDFNGEMSLKTCIFQKLRCLMADGYITRTGTRSYYKFVLTPKGLEYIASLKLRSLLGQKASKVM